MARTPQGAVELENGDLLLGFSAYDFDLPPHYHLVRPHAFMYENPVDVVIRARVVLRSCCCSQAGRMEINTRAWV